MLADIRLQNFRSYVDDSFEFTGGVNIIVGPNASGKTNLLEAVMFVARGQSYRSKDAELIKFEAPWARIDARSGDQTRTVKLQAADNGAITKSFVIDDKPFKRLSLQKTLPLIIFEPNHLLLFSGPPDLRRAFMDDLLEQTTVGYQSLRKQYRRTLAQRNALLKRGYEAVSKQVFAWNVRLSQLGGQIAMHRHDLVEKFNGMATDVYSKLAKQQAVISLQYSSKVGMEQYESNMLHKLEAGLHAECERGFTLYGPHRDDLRVELNGHLVQETASRGETRSLLLMLKVLEARLLEEMRDQKPLLLLDDVFSELDGARRQALTTYLKDYQTFITTTDADVVVQHFLDECTIIPLGKAN